MYKCKCLNDYSANRHDNFNNLLKFNKKVKNLFVQPDVVGRPLIFWTRKL